MLTIEVSGDELFDEATSRFVYSDPFTLELEHSLLAISKWESKHQIPFLENRINQKTTDQMFDYIRCMVVSGPNDIETIETLPSDSLGLINTYIESTQSATTFGNMPERRGPGEIITSELIYYWMVAFTIPFECETWNINRLFALIRICNIKNNPNKKQSKHSIAERNRALNEARRAQYNTAG